MRARRALGRAVVSDLPGLSPRGRAVLARLEVTRLWPGQAGEALQYWREYCRTPDARRWNRPDSCGEWACCPDIGEARSVLKTVVHNLPARVLAAIQNERGWAGAVIRGERGVGPPVCLGGRRDHRCRPGLGGGASSWSRAALQRGRVDRDHGLGFRRAGCMVSRTALTDGISRSACRAATVGDRGRLSWPRDGRIPGVSLPARGK